MWKSNKVADLLNKRQKINKEIEDIQKKCPHSILFFWCVGQ